MTKEFFCPICNSKNFNSISQDLHKCKSCAIVFNSNYKQLQYDEEYFIGDYEKQYGKTYIDDFPNIYELSKKRLNAIISLLNKKTIPPSLNLLDIGSAMGFFLKCAKDKGINDLLGIEISTFAGDYCKNEFLIHTINQPFEKAEINKKYNIITAWYFIEHCEHTVAILEKVFSLLKSEGIFAFSTPSAFGPQYIFNRSLWIDQHPNDHKIDFNPRSVKKILKKVGFRKIIVRPAGIHPERILQKSNLLYNPFSRLYVVFSKLFKFSDTMEIYAVK